MPEKIIPQEVLLQLRALQDSIDALRKEHSISKPDEVIYSSDFGWDELVVEADGFGGATLSVVNGNFPVDYLTKHTHEFKTEDDASYVANLLMEQDLDVEALLLDVAAPGGLAQLKEEYGE